MKDLLHRNIVAVLDHGSAGSAFYFIMELCEGGSVMDLMERQGGKLSLAQAAPIMRHCLDGLVYAHEKGFVHRDLKPHNLLLAKFPAYEPMRSDPLSPRGTSGERAGERGRPDKVSSSPRPSPPSAGGEGEGSASDYSRRIRDAVESVPTDWTAKIGDFGMAKSFQQAGLSGMTVTGNYAGTPGFMPREQVINFRQVKPVTDVWSLGATFYCMLTGKLPRDFPRGVDPMEVVLGGKIVPLRERDASLPKKLAEVIDRSLLVNPKERFQDAGEFRKALDKVL